MYVTCSPLLAEIFPLIMRKSRKNLEISQLFETRQSLGNEARSS